MGEQTMFDVTLESAGAERRVIDRAVDELAHVVARQARLRQSDLCRKRDVLRASQDRRRAPSQRLLAADLGRTEASLLHLARAETAAGAIAAEQIGSLCRCLGGLVAGYDLGGETLGIRIRARAGKGIRMVLLPDPSRRLRVQLQAYGKHGPPAGAKPALPVCLGHRGDAYVDLALDSMHLPTLVLTLVSYVHTNGAPNLEW